MKVFAIIPRAGLGNRLLVWARAMVFSYLNNAEFYIIGLNKFHIGPILRKEKSKRFYLTSFRFRIPFNDYFNYYLSNKKDALFEPKIDKLNNLGKNKIVIFNKIPHWSDYFNELKIYRNFIKAQLLDLSHKKVLNKYFEAESPNIGIHIRMGDFRKVSNIEEMKKFGLARTPIYYFIDCIKKIRSSIGECIPVTVFSDGSEKELTEILSLPNIKLFTSGNDLADLLILSKSKIIITSAGSTFSYWAAFLSDADIIHNPVGFNSSVVYNSIRFEGTLEQFINRKLGVYKNEI